jgi:hypothetical protein
MKDRDVVKLSSLYEIDLPESVMVSLGANLGDNILFIEEEGKIYLKKE